MLPFFGDIIGDIMNDEIYKKLIEMAFNAREKSYCPYSNYAVGASLLTDDGKLYKGTNIENASFGATICAERAACVNAIGNGAMKIKIIAIVGGKVNEDTEYAYPCGICRQFLNEFCDEDTMVIVAKSIKLYKVFKFNELLPKAFGPNNVK